MYKKFRDEQMVKWEGMLNELFNNSIPERYEWADVDTAIQILNFIAKSKAANHTFFPNSGGMDIKSAIKSHEDGCVEISFDGCPTIYKHRKLVFQGFPNADIDWSHFRIISNELQPSGVYEQPTEECEQLLELSAGNYVDYGYWDAGQYEGRPIPPNARPISRFFYGDFVIFSKGSLYNANPDYSDRHRYEALFIERINNAIKTKSYERFLHD